MKCPKCNKSMKVIDSRMIGDRRIRRRYCADCQYDMFTAEQKMDYVEGMMIINDFYKKNWKQRKEDK